MALRQRLTFPGFEWVVKDELKAVKAMRPPVDVEFRRGANPNDVAADVVLHSSVRLCAAVGSGKSVRIPAALAYKTKALVFHVVPNRPLVGHLYSYLTKMSQADPAFMHVPFDRYYGDVEQVPRNGVFVISAVDVVDMMMYHGGFSKFKGCSVFLDEAHESDAYTHTVRALAIQMGADRLVQASATFDPSVHGVRNTPGSVVMKPVDMGAPCDWEVDKAGSPFQVGTMRDGVLVFVDSRAAAARLTVLYERSGLDVFRLTSTSSDEEVAQAMRAASDKRGGLVAILADYSYRSGFTFPVSRVVDTGVVAYYDASPGEFRRLTRRMFQFEREQAAGRVGRILDNAEYYYQKGDCPAVMCDLEGVEREGAAYIFKCLGYKPDGVLAGAFMASNNLPAGVSVRASLNGLYPLTYYVKNAPKVDPEPISAPVVKEETVAVMPPSYGEAVDKDPVREHEEIRSKEVKRDSGVGIDLPAGWQFVADEILAHEEVAGLTDGVYHISQVRDTAGRGVAATLTFPAGLQSVREFARRKNFEFAVSALSLEDRKWAFNSLLDSYNTVTAQVRGAKLAVRDVMMVARTTGFVDKVKDIVEGLSADHADALSCLRAAEKFMMSADWSKVHDGKTAAEGRVRDAYYMQLISKRRSRGEADLDADLAHSVDRRIQHVLDKNLKRGKEIDGYEGRKLELLMPAWMGGKLVSYDKIDSGKQRDPKMRGGGDFMSGRSGEDVDTDHSYGDKVYTYTRTLSWQ